MSKASKVLQVRKTMTLLEIREELAASEVEQHIDEDQLMELFMDGIVGYRNIPADDLVEFYVQTAFPEINIEDDEPVIVLAVMDDDNKTLLFNVVQHQGNTEIKKL